MNRALITSLTEAEQALIAETGPDAMADLTEDELVALHDRIRKARGKYRSIYRRSASQRVARHGGRGKARPKNRHNSDRLEVFEDALSRVSRALATAARAAASELRTERIEAARAAKAVPEVAAAPPRRPATKRTSAKGATARTAVQKSPRTRKATASTRAGGARRQAKRDSR